MTSKWQAGILIYVILRLGLLKCVGGANYNSSFCPKPCLCSQRAWEPGREINCNSAGLTALPSLPPPTDLAHISAGSLLLDGNGFGAVPPAYFAQFVNVSALYLRNNSVSLTLTNGSFDGLGNLLFLHLDRTVIGSLFPGIFTGVPRLQQLYLTGCGVAEVPAGAFLPASSQLTQIYLDANHIRTLQRDSFRGVTSLVELHLSANGLRAIQADVFQATPLLRQLALSNNNLSKLAPDLFSPLGVLEVLDLTLNPLMDCAVIEGIIAADQEDLQFIHDDTCTKYPGPSSTPDPSVIQGSSTPASGALRLGANTQNPGLLAIVVFFLYYYPADSTKRT